MSSMTQLTSFFFVGNRKTHQFFPHIHRQGGKSSSLEKKENPSTRLPQGEGEPTELRTEYHQLSSTAGGKGRGKPPPMRKKSIILLKYSNANCGGLGSKRSAPRDGGFHGLRHCRRRSLRSHKNRLLVLMVAVVVTGFS